MPRPAIWVAKADTVGEDGASVGACEGMGVEVNTGAETGVFVKIRPGVEEETGRGRGVYVAKDVAVAVAVEVEVTAKVAVVVAEGLGVTTSQPSLRFRKIMYPSAAIRTRTNTESMSFLMRYTPKLT